MVAEDLVYSGGRQPLHVRAGGGKARACVGLRNCLIGLGFPSRWICLAHLDSSRVEISDIAL
eukprot:2488040-Rhodomonas_salina.2